MDPAHGLIAVGLFFLVLWAVALLGRFYQRRREDRGEPDQAPLTGPADRKP